VASFCEHSDEPFGSVQGGEFLNQLSDICFSRKTSLWIELVDVFVNTYTPRHQNTSFKVTAKSYNVATRTAELRQVGRFAGLLTSACCNIFICFQISELF
jgi:hypothetical protein